MSRSGSTWLYNVVRAFRPDLTGIYCERGSDLPEPAHGLLIKCHGPDDAMIGKVLDEGFPVILTVRDPRDVAVSFMDCFHETLSAAMATLPLCAAPIVKLADSAALTLKYENDFPHQIGTVEAVARLAGSTSELAPDEVSERLHRDSVRREVARLEREVFDPALGPAQHDAQSHWHPSHVGDAMVGKFADRLGQAEQAEILDLTRTYCDRFGYRAVAAIP